ATGARAPVAGPRAAAAASRLAGVGGETDEGTAEATGARRSAAVVAAMPGARGAAVAIRPRRRDPRRPRVKSRARDPRMRWEKDRKGAAAAAAGADAPASGSRSVRP